MPLLYVEEELSVSLSCETSSAVAPLTRLAKKLGLTVDVQFMRGGGLDLVHAIAPLAGVTLVGWQHEAIPIIAGLLPATGFPPRWADARFDVIWRFTRARAGGVWTFDQLCPALLAGDSTDPIVKPEPSPV